VPSKAVRAADHIADGNLDVGMFKAHTARAQATVAHSHVSSLHAKVVDSASSAAGVVAERRAALTEAIESRKAVLDELVQSSMATAEDLARTNRVGNRELGLLDP
jgi:hypothetical protein